MKKDRKILVLYSWEENSDEAKKWALSLCYELQCYKSVEVTCDMLWLPYSDVKSEINQKIHDSDNILVIVTKSYNKKIQYRRGMVSYEELIYEKIVKQSEEKNKILFLQKDPNVPLPKGWDGYNRIDVSIFNRECFFQKSAKEREERIDQIIRFCFNIPEYDLFNIPYKNKKALPGSISAQTFAQRYCENIIRDNWRSENLISVKQQESRLLKLIKDNISQESFVDLYIRAGLSADLNLGGKMTPQLFKKHFLVNREDKEDEKYNEIINELFSATNQNCLCLQSDGGSGKSTFIQTMSLRRKNKRGEYFTNIIFDLSNLTENDNTKEDLLFQRVRKEYNRMSKNSGEYYLAWRDAFEKRVQEIEDVIFNDSRLYAVHDVQLNLRMALPNLVPDLDRLEDWYKGYTERISKAKNTDSRVLFIVLMMIYLMILDCKPQLDDAERFIIVFDNIETYDNGRAAEKISNYVETCYKYAKSIFLELGRLDNFYNKFTLVVVLRTSTLIPFGNFKQICGQGTILSSKLSILILLKKLY